MFNLNLNIFFWILLFLAIFFLAIGLYARNYGRRREPIAPQAPAPQAAQEPAGQTWKQKLIGYGVFALIVFLIATTILYYTGSADRSFNTTELKKMCSGGCQISGGAIILSEGTLKIPNNDFGEIAIYLTEKLSKRDARTAGDVMNVSIGSHKAHVWVDKCQYTQSTICYRGEWWYTAASPELGETHSSRDELQYAEASLLPLRITKGYPDLTAITSTTNLEAKIGDKTLVTALRNNAQTPQPVKGTLVIECSKCSIREVKIYYAWPNRLRNILIGWI